MSDKRTNAEYWSRLLSVACPHCGVGQQEQCISRSGQTRYSACDSHTERMEMAKRAGVFGATGNADEDA